jgi:hypothetical protein
MVRMRAFGLRIPFRHIRALFRLPVIIRSIAVVDVARRIHPYQPRTAPRSLRASRHLLRWRHLPRCPARRSRSSWCSRRGSSRCRSRSSWSCLSGGSWCSRSRSSRGRGRIPLLHPLMASTRPLFTRGRRIGSVLAHPRRSRRWRCLGGRQLCTGQPCRNRHQTDCNLHKYSR